MLAGEGGSKLRLDALEKGDPLAGREGGGPGKAQSWEAGGPGWRCSLVIDDGW